MLGVLVMIAATAALAPAAWMSQRAPTRVAVAPVCGIRPPSAASGNSRVVAVPTKRQQQRQRGKFAQQQRELLVSGDELGAARAAAPFCYLCVLDVEATCERDAKHFKHEIIEFPVVLVDLFAEGGPAQCGEFHSYVRPTANKTLTKFCTELTGITQEMVDAAPPLPEVLAAFDAWLQQQGLSNSPQLGATAGRDFAFATDGPWDLRFFLDADCTRKGIGKPLYFDKWVNLKALFADFYRVRQCKIHKMLAKQGMRFEGRLHSGIDDARNIARIAIKLAADGCKMYVNEALPPRQSFRDQGDL